MDDFNNGGCGNDFGGGFNNNDFWNRNDQMNNANQEQYVFDDLDNMSKDMNDMFEEQNRFNEEMDAQMFRDMLTAHEFTHWQMMWLQQEQNRRFLEEHLSRRNYDRVYRAYENTKEKNKKKRNDKILFWVKICVLITFGTIFLTRFLF